MLHKIISTTGQNCEFCFYEGEKTAPTISKKILVLGGAGVCPSGTIYTPNYRETEVSDEDLELLKTHPVFNRKVKAGFYKVVKANEKANADDLEKKDGSAQLTQDEFIVDTNNSIDEIPEEKTKGKKHKVKVKRD